MPFPQVSPKHDLRKLLETTRRAGPNCDGERHVPQGWNHTLRSSAIRELRSEKHAEADTPERAEAPSHATRSLDSRAARDQSTKKDACGRAVCD